MAALPKWNVAQFGCLTRDNTSVDSLMRNVVSSELPVPAVSRKGDTSAPLVLQFALDVTEAGMRSWQQWVVNDLADGALSFTVFLSWGTQQPRVRARLLGEWKAQRFDSFRWSIAAQMEIERWTLPRFSGGANA